MKHIIQILLLLTLFLVEGCHDLDDKNNTESKDEKLDTTTSQKHDNVPVEMEEVKHDSVPLISGSCEDGRDVGDLNQYSIKMKVGTSPTDSISVRSDASCFNIEMCDHNILGKIKSGTIVYAQGPLKNADFSAGIAYAFPVKDKNGNMCRGYLSYLNLEEL